MSDFVDEEQWTYADPIKSVRADHDEIVIGLENGALHRWPVQSIGARCLYGGVLILETAYETFKFRGETSQQSQEYFDQITAARFEALGYVTQKLYESPQNSNQEVA